MPRSLAELQADAVKLLGVYLDTPFDVRTPVVRRLAITFVKARGLFLNDHSQPDYKGLTHAYRAWVSEVYSLAHISREDRPPIQASVRYHVGTVLREVLDEKTLDDLGLFRQSPKERTIQRRSEKLALLNLLIGQTTRSEKADDLRVRVEHAILTEDIDTLVRWINAFYSRDFRETK